MNHMELLGTSGAAAWSALFAQTDAQAGSKPEVPAGAVGPNGTIQPATLGSPANGAKAPPPASPFGPGMIWILGAMLGVMVLTSVLTGRKDKKKRAEIMSSLKRNDRVVMSGGIIGTITEIADDEVVVRMEEGKIRFSRAAVQQVLKEARAGTETGKAAAASA